jgi:hypothetical protein
LQILATPSALVTPAAFGESDVAEIQRSFEKPTTSPVMAPGDAGESSSSMTYTDEEYLEDEMVVDEQHTLYNDSDYQ